MLILYSICAFFIYKLCKNLISNNHIILDDISMIDLYDNTHNSKEYNSKEYNNALFAFNQIPT